MGVQIGAGTPLPADQNAPAVHREKWQKDLAADAPLTPTVIPPPPLGKEGRKEGGAPQHRASVAVLPVPCQ